MFLTTPHCYQILLKLAGGIKQCWKLTAKQMGKKTEKLSAWASFPLGTSLIISINKIWGCLISISQNLGFHYVWNPYQWGIWKKYLNILLCYVLLGFVHSILADPVKKCLQRRKNDVQTSWYSLFSLLYITLVSHQQCGWLPLRLNECNHLPNHHHNS